MQSLRNFIIKVDVDFNEKYTTKGGLDLYAHKRFSGEQLSNKTAIVLSNPKFSKENETIPENSEILIDPTIFYQQNYNNSGDQDHPYVIDRNKGIYQISPSMVVMWRENPEKPWKGFSENLLIEVNREITDEVKSNNLVSEINKVEEKTFVKYSNSIIEQSGVKSGSEVVVRKEFGVPYTLVDRGYRWYKNNDILAVIR